MYKTILLYLPSVEAAEVVSMEAAALAQTYGATLVGVHNTIRITVYGGIPQDVLAHHNERERRDAEAIKFIFEDVAKRQQVAHEWRSRVAKDVDAFREIVAECHAADLVVAPAKDFADPLGHWFDLPERLAMETGRPLLLLPRNRPVQSFGKRIMVAWNGSREAARAAFDAMPMLQSADYVCVLTIADSLAGRRSASANDFHAALVRQGVKAELEVVGAMTRGDGEELLDHAASRDCDMLVMGFYGRSRFSEMIWGGVTRHVLEAMTIPVFTAH